MALKDIVVPDRKDLDQYYLAVVEAANEDPWQIVRIGKGQYVTPLNHLLDTGMKWQEKYPTIEGVLPYGVVDTPEQFMQLFGEAVSADRRKMFVCFTSIKRVDQDKVGGWRWHKWGPYYGTKNPQYEYLYDEEDIDEVYIYHIFLHAGQ